MCTCYQDGSLQSDLGAPEAAAHALVGACVLGFDLPDEQAAVGQQGHAAKGEKKDKRLMILGHIRAHTHLSSGLLEAKRMEEKHTHGLGLAVHLYGPASL